MLPASQPPTNGKALHEPLPETAGQAVIDVRRAMRLNRRYADSLGWADAADRIARLLGFRSRTPGDGEFTQAVARWQRDQHLAADGVIGPATWRLMRTAIGLAPYPRATAVLTAPGPGYYSYVASERRFGLPETIRAVMAIGAAWQRTHPGGPRIGVGDISHRGGGPMAPHRSHDNGLDVDFRPMRNDGVEGPTDYQAATYSQTLTHDLVNVIRANGVLPVKYIFFNDPAISGVQPWPRHDNHMHVRFMLPEGPSRKMELDAHSAALRSAQPSGTQSLQAGGSASVDRAVRLNRYYARHLRWRPYFPRIVSLLGFTNQSPGEASFAEAVATWQRAQGLAEDGAIGPRTWEKMRSAIGLVPPTGAEPTVPVSSGELPQGPFGTLSVSVSGRSPFTYTFTPEDALWAARMIVGEAGGRDDPDNEAVMWAMFNRYALFTHRAYPTFQQFVRAYSTPLQAVLRNAGAARRHMGRPDFVRTGGYYPDTRIPKGQLQRHIRLQQTPWNQLPASARSLVERTMKGQVPNPGIGNASEFASTHVYFNDRYGRVPTENEWRRFTDIYARRKNWVWVGPVQGLNQQRNAFFVDRRAAGLPPNAVRIIAQQ